MTAWCSPLIQLAYFLFDIFAVVLNAYLGFCLKRKRIKQESRKPGKKGRPHSRPRTTLNTIKYSRLVLKAMTLVLELLQL